MTQPIFVTGGAGFIGSNFVRSWIAQEECGLVNYDSLTYAGNLMSLDEVSASPHYHFVHGDICDGRLLAETLGEMRPRAILHFAAESHVDRSIVSPGAFIQTNIHGTFTLLESARAYLRSLSAAEREAFRFIHVSTDEVYGTLRPSDPAFEETTPYAPNSPYAASKAASDHLVRSYVHTYNLPAIITNCSNNYGPYQFPEKLIPLMITSALAGRPLPVYGDGLQVRDWLYVGDHCSALRTVLAKGEPGETYNIGGWNEQSNIRIVETICALLDELASASSSRPHAQLIRYVEDRPGHDRRYAINARKIQAELGWTPTETLASGLRKTVQWYLSNPAWLEAVSSGSYRDWLATNYEGRGVR